MKRFLSLILALVCILSVISLCGCEKKMKTVKITVSAGTLKQEELNDLDAYAESRGYKKVKYNKKDNTVTIELDDSKHNIMLYKLGSAVVGNIYSLMDSDSSYPYVTNIDRNDDFTEIGIDVDREAYEKDSTHSLIFTLVGTSCLTYLAYTDYDREDQICTVIIRDNVTKEIIDKEVFSQEDFG